MGKRARNVMAQLMNGKKSKECDEVKTNRSRISIGRAFYDLCRCINGKKDSKIIGSNPSSRSNSSGFGENMPKKKGSKKKKKASSTAGSAKPAEGKGSGGHGNSHGGDDHGHGGDGHSHSHGGHDHGHSHGGDDHGHSHGGDDHGHSHGGGDHSHSHGGGGHGHSHGGDDHGHSHGGGDHGHSHGGVGHGHSHGGTPCHGHGGQAEQEMSSEPEGENGLAGLNWNPTPSVPPPHLIKCPAPQRRPGESRADYYDRWGKMAKAMEQEADEEEKQRKEEAEKKARQEPRSAAEAKDREANARLKAKKEAMDKLKGEVEVKVEVPYEKGVKEKVITMDDPIFAQGKAGKHPALVIKGGKDCRYNLQGLMLAKLFIEDCKGCTVEVDSKTKLITHHIEVYKCDNSYLRLDVSVATIQADRCNKLDVYYAHGTVVENITQLFHAHCHKLTVNIADTHLVEHGSELLNDEDDLAQYVSHLVDGKLITERAVRPQGYQGRPLTLRQLRAEVDKADAAVGDAKQRGDQVAVLGTQAHADKCAQNLKDAEDVIARGVISPESAIANAKRSKDQGNDCFKEQEYGQAIVKYTEGVLSLERAFRTSTASDTQKQAVRLTESEEAKKLRSVLLTNRAACFLKLGQPEKALKDAETASNLDPTNIKANFRWGLSLHALDKPAEALPRLAAALKLEPHNKQIQQAIRFSEVKAAQQAK
eukprot:g25862.t1